MLRHRATLAVAGVAFAVMSIVSGVANRSVSDDPIDVISLQTSFTVDRFTAVAAPWGITGMEDFRRNLFVVDLAFPAAYALLLTVLFARHAPGAPRWAFFAPLAAALADVAENSLHAVALGRLIAGEAAPVWAVLGGCLFAAAKWLLLLTALITLSRRVRDRHPTMGATLAGVGLFTLVALAFSL